MRRALSRLSTSPGALAASLAQPLPFAEPAKLGLCPSRLQRLEDYFRRKEAYAGGVLAVARHGQVCHLSHFGKRDLASGSEMLVDTIFRAYSLTKIVTSVALLQLYEQGLFQLDEPLSAFMPKFGQTLANKTREGVVDTEPLEQPITVRHLLTHTSGFTYPFDGCPVSEEYSKVGAFVHGIIGGIGAATSPSLERWVDLVAEVPLKFQPGTGFAYGVNCDIIGRLVEVLSGKPFHAYLQDHIFEPLGMVDTGFSLPAAHVPRLATMYEMGDDGLQPCTHFMDVPTEAVVGPPPAFQSGGAGLLTTAPDFMRFSLMLAGGGSFGPARILGRKTVELMTRNHLPGGGDLATLEGGESMPDFYHSRGLGFGLGVAVVLRPELGIHCSDGSYFWQGLGSTYHFNDPVENLTVLLMTQFMPCFGDMNARYAIAGLAEQALVD